MSGLGEWDDDAPVYDLGDAPVVDEEEVDDGDLDQPRAGVAGPVSAALAGVDVAAIAGDLIAATVDEEIRRQVHAKVSPVVKQAVASVLTADRLDELRAAAVAAAEAHLNPSTAETRGEDAPPALYYGSVEEFVREFVCPIFRRNIGEETRADYRWSARWWESAEAITRLEAMWRAWEHLRLDPATGTSVWLRDHADHHLGVLMSPTGPFSRSKDSARPEEPLPYEAPPEGLFPDVRNH